MARGRWGVIVLAWLGQILLFFIFWRLLHWMFGNSLRQLSLASMVTQIVLNVVVAVVLLIIVDNVHSAWGLMPFVGAVVGVFTGEMAANGKREGR